MSGHPDDARPGRSVSVRLINSGRAFIRQRGWYEDAGP